MLSLILEYIMEIAQDYLKECFDYNPDTGSLKWKARDVSHFKTLNAASVWNSKYANTEVGTLKSGRKILSLDGKKHKVHRIIWIICHGQSPENHIDHINGNPEDNRLENLRDVTNAENHKNRKIPKTNTSGVHGVSWYKRKQKWQAMIRTSGGHLHLGYFDSLDEAAKARKEAEKLHGYHVNHGR